MQIKLRKKGEVIVSELLWETSEILTTLALPPGFDNVDLTGYSVIDAYFGRGRRNEIAKLAESAPKAIILWHLATRELDEDGIIFPVGFKPTRVKYWKSFQRVWQDACDAANAAQAALKAEVEAAIPNLRVFCNTNTVDPVRHWGDFPAPTRTVAVTPRQAVYSDDPDWVVTASSLDEAIAGVEARKPFWRMWDDRILAAFQAAGNPVDDNGVILYFGRDSNHKLTGDVFVGRFGLMPDQPLARGWARLTESGLSAPAKEIQYLMLNRV